MSSTITVIGTGWAGGQWPPKAVVGAVQSGTVTGISSSRPFDVALYDGDGAANLLYTGGMSPVPTGIGAVPVNKPVNNAAFSLTGLSIGYAGGLYLYSKSGSDIVLTFA